MAREWHYLIPATNSLLLFPTIYSRLTQLRQSFHCSDQQQNSTVSCHFAAKQQSGKLE